MGSDMTVCDVSEDVSEGFDTSRGFVVIDGEGSDISEGVCVGSDMTVCDVSEGFDTSRGFVVIDGSEGSDISEGSSTSEGVCAGSDIRMGVSGGFNTSRGLEVIDGEGSDISG